MVSSILRIISQVEHTKKHNRIDSERKSVKQNADHQNPFNSVFLHEKVFGLNRALWLKALTDQVYVMVLIDWRTSERLFCWFYKQMSESFC